MALQKLGLSNNGGFHASSNDDDYYEIENAIGALATCLKVDEDSDDNDVDDDSNCSSSLTNLSLANNKLSDKCMALLISSMHGKTIPFSLDLSCNEFGNKASQALRNCHCPLLNLSLSGCSKFNPSIMKSLALGFQQGTCSMKSLKFDCNEITNQCVSRLVQALAVPPQSSSSLSHSPIQELSLNCMDYFWFTNVGIKYIADLLPYTKLQYLSLCDNVEMGNVGVTLLANCLNYTQLTELRLGDVTMTDAGIIALANVLKTNTKLSTLDIHENAGITRVGKDALYETIRDYNRTLTRLYCSNTGDDSLDDLILFYVTLNRLKQKKIYDPNFVNVVSLVPYILQPFSFDPCIIYWLLSNIVLSSVLS